MLGFTQDILHKPFNPAGDLGGNLNEHGESREQVGIGGIRVKVRMELGNAFLYRCFEFLRNVRLRAAHPPIRSRRETRRVEYSRRSGTRIPTMRG